MLASGSDHIFPIVRCDDSMNLERFEFAIEPRHGLQKLPNL